VWRRPNAPWESYPDAAKAPIIRAYLDIWSAETERFFDGITKESPDADIDALAPGFPVFRIN
jgi:hypothetical protein